MRMRNERVIAMWEQCHSLRRSVVSSMGRKLSNMGYSHARRAYKVLSSINYKMCLEFEIKRNILKNTRRCIYASVPTDFQVRTVSYGSSFFPVDLYTFCLFEFEIKRNSLKNTRPCIRRGP